MGAICDGLAMAFAQDLRTHPHAPLRLRIACYEVSHRKHVQVAKAKVLESLFDESAGQWEGWEWGG